MYMQDCDKNYTRLDERSIQRAREFLPAYSSLRAISSFFSAFSDPTRMRITCALSISSMCVNDLVRVLKINQTTLSHQLAYLRSVNVLSARREGKQVFYSIKNKRILSLLSEAVQTLEEYDEGGNDEYNTL